MKTLFILMSLVGFASSVFALETADFSGHWVATQGNISGSISGNCSKIEITISQTPTGITTEKYQATCDNFGSSWGPMVDTIQNGIVFDDDGEKIGSIDSSKMLLSIPDTGITGIIYTYNLQLQAGPDGKPMLKSDYGTRDSHGGLMVEALLSKVSP